MNSEVRVIVRMQVECARCGHTEDETYEFEMSFAKSQPMEAQVSGGRSAQIQMHLKRNTAAAVDAGGRFR